MELLDLNKDQRPHAGFAIGRNLSSPHRNGMRARLDPQSPTDSMIPYIILL